MIVIYYYISFKNCFIKIHVTFQIKILRRSAVNDEKKTTPKHKTEAELKQTLKLREAEYQAARYKIDFLDSL